MTFRSVAFLELELLIKRHFILRKVPLPMELKVS